MTSTISRRHFLAALPALAMTPRALAQSGAAPPIRVRGLSQMTLTVSDVKRSLDFYQGLFGMPVQARQGSTILLRVGAGPQFLALRQVGSGETPSISAFGLGVEDFDQARLLRILAEHGVSASDRTVSDTGRPGPMTVRVRTRRPEAAGAAGSTSEMFVGDPSGIVFQLHDATYCGGGGPLGNVCEPIESAPKKGLLAVRDLSHFTIGVSDQERTVAFYQGLFGMPVQVRQGTAPAYAVGPGVHFLMFTGGAAGAGRGGPGAAPRVSRIDHACLAMDSFNPEAVTKTLVSYGITPRQGASRDPLGTYISLRMPNRGGAEGGTPELYLTDPDGLAIQLQDMKYCGGGGFLGDVCPPL